MTNNVDKKFFAPSTGLSNMFYFFFETVLFSFYLGLILSRIWSGF